MSHTSPIHLRHQIQKASLLVKIFQVETDPKMIQEGISILTYTVEHRICDAEYAQNKISRATVIADYHAGYWS